MRAAHRIGYLLFLLASILVTLVAADLYRPPQRVVLQGTAQDVIFHPLPDAVYTTSGRTLESHIFVTTITQLVAFGTSVDLRGATSHRILSRTTPDHVAYFSSKPQGVVLTVPAGRAVEAYAGGTYSWRLTHPGDYPQRFDVGFIIDAPRNTPVWNLGQATDCNCALQTVAGGLYGYGKGALAGELRGIMGLADPRTEAFTFPGKYLEIRGYTHDGKLPVNTMRILPKIELLLAHPMDDRRWNFESTTTTAADFTGAVTYGIEHHDLLNASVDLPTTATLALAATPSGLRTEIAAVTTSLRINGEEILPTYSVRFATKLYATLTVSAGLLVALIELIASRITLRSAIRRGAEPTATR
jgi:hypothetical protein